MYSQKTTSLKDGFVFPVAFSISFGSTMNCCSIQVQGDGVIVGVGVGVGVASAQGQTPGEH